MLNRPLLDLGFLAMGLTAPSAGAATLQVPKDFKTIQAAVDAAQPGDTVLVKAGTREQVCHKPCPSNGGNMP